MSNATTLATLEPIPDDAPVLETAALVAAFDHKAVWYMTHHDDPVRQIRVQVALPIGRRWVLPIIAERFGVGVVKTVNGRLVYHCGDRKQLIRLLPQLIPYSIEYRSYNALLAMLLAQHTYLTARWSDQAEAAQQLDETTKAVYEALGLVFKGYDHAND